MAAPKYAQRVARLPEVFELLGAHPHGLPLVDLATRLGVPAEELREDLMAFFTADVGGLLGLSRPDVLDFVGPDGAEADPNDAEIVRLIDERPTDELGVEHVDAAELALVYTAAQALLEADPDDADLAGALDVLTETMLGEGLAPDGEAEDAVVVGPLAALRRAAASFRRVRIVYSRSWYAGVTERVVEPYRLVQTRRGWELDAGLPDRGGEVRTFLLSNVRELEVLDEGYTAPADLEARLAEQRRTSTVRVRIGHHARWAADMYAERVTVVADDETEVTLDLELLPPVDERLGLLLLAAGPDAAVVEPPGLIAVGPRLAAELLAHHRHA
jgi:proteasome accessory factor C